MLAFGFNTVAALFCLLVALLEQDVLRRSCVFFSKTAF